MAATAMARKRKGVPLHGWLVLDKPGTMTSTQALGKVRWLLNAEKAGHGGTLDPIATGILPIALGEATKTVQYAMDGHKEYRFVCKFGEATDTDDRAGTVIATAQGRPTDAEIEAALPSFIGTIHQVPPQYSAIKIDGERAYDLARVGEQVELASRAVRIDAFQLISRPDADHAEFEVACGKGTYVRSLARDLAAMLGTVAHITVLRRLRVGPFSLASAITLEAVAAHVDAGGGPEALLMPVAAPLNLLPQVELSAGEAERLRHGQAIQLCHADIDHDRLADIAETMGADGTALALCAGHPVALVRLLDGVIRPVRVLNL